MAFSARSEFDNDPVRLIAHYVEMQAHYSGPLIQGPGGSILDEGALPPSATQPGDATVGGTRCS
jgi:hypothetical protein